MRISDDTIYSTDNGRLLCGKHLGSTAKATGRDLSGQTILAIGPDEATYCQATFGEVPECETCGKRASLLAPFLIPCLR